MEKILLIIAAVVMLTATVAQAAEAPNACEVFLDDKQIMDMTQTNIICNKTNTIDTNIEAKYGDLRHVIGSVSLGVGVETTKSMQTFCNTITDSMSFPTAYVGRSLLFITGKAIKQVWHANDKKYTIRDGTMEMLNRLYDYTHGTGFFNKDPLPQYAFMTMFFDIMQASRENHRPLPEDFKKLMAAYIKASRKAAVNVITSKEAFNGADMVRDACWNDPDILCRDINKAAKAGEKVNFDKGIKACLDGIKFVKEGGGFNLEFGRLQEQGKKFSQAGGIAFYGLKDYKKAAEFFGHAASAYEFISKTDLTTTDIEYEADNYTDLLASLYQMNDANAEIETAKRYLDFASTHIPEGFDVSWSILERGEALKFLSWAYSNKGEWTESEDALQKAYSVVTQYTGKNAAIAKEITDLDVLKKKIAEAKEAGETLSKKKKAVEAGRTCSKASNDPDLKNMANPDAAIGACWEYADFAHTEKDITMEAIMLSSIGEITALAKNDFKAAIDYYTRANTLFDEAAKKGELDPAYCRNLIDLGTAYTNAGEWEKATETFKRSFKTAQNFKDEGERAYWTANTLLYMSVYIAKVYKNPEQSEELLTKAYSALQSCPKSKCSEDKYKTLANQLDDMKTRIAKLKAETAKPQKGKQEAIHE